MYPDILKTKFIDQISIGIFKLIFIFQWQILSPDTKPRKLNIS